MIFIRIADCYHLGDSVVFTGSHAKYGNIILSFMDTDGSLLPDLHAAAVEPVEPDYSLMSKENFGTSSTGVVVPPIQSTQLSSAEALKVEEEREQRRLQIQIAAREDRAMVAMLGADRRTMGEGLPPNSIWLILCTNDEGSTWRRHGIVVIYRERAKCFVGAEGTESRVFCIV